MKNKMANRFKYAIRKYGRLLFYKGSYPTWNKAYTVAKMNKKKYRGIMYFILTPKQSYSTMYQLYMTKPRGSKYE